LWGRIGPPRKAKLQNRSPNPKKIAVWNRLLSVWKRMEAFGSDSKRLMAFGFQGLCLSLKENCKKNMVFMRV
jgi:hypothetical protein